MIISDAIVPIINIKHSNQDLRGAFLSFYIKRLLSIFLEPIFMVAE